MTDVDKVPKPDKTNDDSDFDDLDSSDDERQGPPPMLNIERGSDFSAVFMYKNDRSLAIFQKNAVISAAVKPTDKEKPGIELGVGKENLSSLTTTFEELTKQGGPPKTSSNTDKPVVVVDKEQYSSFKEKFENIDKITAEKEQERKSLHERDIHGLGAEGLTKAKDRFEHLNQSEQNVERKGVEIERSEADKKLVQKTFFEASDKEEPKDCSVCGKIVYPVEKVQLEKKVFHKQCFKCCKCQKRLSVQNYTTHEGKLYCKLHILEIFRPEMALAYERGELADEMVDEIDDEEGDYAVVSKAKVLDPSVVKSGFKTTDDLETIGSLKNKKSEWAKSAEQAGKPEKRTELEAEMFQQGKVKSRLSKFVEGEPEHDEEDEEEDEHRDPNIIKSSKKKEKVIVDVGAKQIKSKWESGTVERAQGETENRTQELDEIKKNVSVKERFKEKSGPEEDDPEKRKSHLDEHPIDTTFSHAAKERFLKGDAFQDTAPIEKTSTDDVKFSELGSVKERFEKQPLDEKVAEKTVIDARCAELGGIKAAFESAGKKGTTDEDLDSRKKEHLEQEFKRIQDEKKAMKENERRENEENLNVEGATQSSDDVKQCADLSSIKQRFEAGPSAFGNETGSKKTEVDMDSKIAGKARQKFKQIDQEGPKDTQMSASKTLENSKWAKDSGPKPEPINKRQVEAGEDEGPDDFEVKNLLSKFKNIEQGKQADEAKGSKPKRQITPPPEGLQQRLTKTELITEGKERDSTIIPTVSAEELAGIKVEAKNLKAKFENVGSEKQDSEEKRKYLEEEFKKLKELKESQKLEEPQEEPEGEKDDERGADLAIAAEHGQKSRAKWEKIEKKEAKKAQKAAAAVKRPAQTLLRFRTPVPDYCAVCTRKVYLAERFECDARLYHKPCFRCKHCGFNLRLENYASGPDGIYCKTHYKILFNDMSQTYFDGRKTEIPIMICIPSNAAHQR